MKNHLNKGRAPVFWIVCASLFLFAALVYLGGVYYFRNHFPLRTTFMGEDVSYRSVDVIDRLLDEESDACRLTIREMNGAQETLYLASDIGYRVSVTEPAEGWIPENTSWRWPQSLFSPTVLSAEENISYSEEMLSEAVNGLEAMKSKNVTEPRDAYIQWKDGICYIVPEDDGNQLLYERACAAVRSAVETGLDYVDLEAAGCYNTASIRRDDEALNEYVARYASIGFQTITIDMTGAKVVLTPENVLNFYVDGDPEQGLDGDKLAEYVTALKSEYDTYEQQRPFTTHYGDEIMAGTWADTYGFRLDKDATIALLRETLESKTSAEIEPVWVNAGWVREENGSDIGNTYIEVCIDEQHLWAYIDGEQIMETDVVTGTRNSRDTPRGVFRIISKEQNTYLVGNGYRSFVNYWMQITWDGVGLHDASWRSYYGGNIYTYDGSHGCINMPYAAAQQLYESFVSESPVVVW